MTYQLRTLIAVIAVLVAAVTLNAQDKKPAAFKEVTYCVTTSDTATVYYVNNSGGEETDRAFAHEDPPLIDGPTPKTREGRLEVAWLIKKSFCSWSYSLKAKPGATVGIRVVNDGDGWTMVDLYIDGLYIFKPVRTATAYTGYGVASVTAIVPGGSVKP